MPNPALEAVDPPYVAFRFEVVLNLDDPPDGVTDPVCNAAFAECEGLEMSIEPKVVREGGDNARQTHLIGPASYGTLTLRRGMTDNLDLWTWFAAAAQPGRAPTAQGQVTLWAADGTPRLTFALENCLPVRLRGPSLNAKDGQVAIEELQLAYAGLSVRPAGGAGFGLSLNVGVSVGVGGGVAAGVSAGVSVSGGPGLSGSASFSASGSAGLSIG
ncbi:MAG TPA: phage tail protein [Chloroflexota bacterium]|jgi:phage tail-like protein